MRILQDTQKKQVEKKNTTMNLPPKGGSNMEKIYGNLNDIVSYEERQMID